MAITKSGNNIIVTDQLHTIQEIVDSQNLPVRRLKKNNKRVEVDLGGNSIVIQNGGEILHPNGYFVTATGGARRVITVKNTGKYILGESRIVNSRIKYNDNAQLMLSNNTGTPYNVGNMGLSVEGGGKFHQYGSTLITNNSMIFFNNSSIVLRNANWVIDSDIQYVTIYMETANKDVNGIKITDVNSSNGVVFLGYRRAGGVFNRFAPVGVKAAFAQVDNANTGVIEFEEYDNSAGVHNDVSYRTTDINTQYNFNKAVNGHDLTISGHGGGSQSRGHTRVSIDFKPKIIDSVTGLGLSTGKYYLKDSNNGNRSTNTSLLADDKSYSNTVTSVGDFNKIKITTALFHNGGDDNRRFEYVKDVRMPVKGFAHSYGYNVAQIVLNNHKQQTVADNILLVKDLEIDQTKTEAQSITTVSTASDFIAVVELYFSNQTEILRKKYFKRVSRNITAQDSYNIIFDKTASAVCAYDDATKTFTIKCDTYIDNITTTNKVSIANGAKITGTFIDSTQDSAILIEGVVSWKEKTTGKSSTIGAAPFAFKYVANTVYSFELMLTSGIMLDYDVTPTKIGVLNVSLGEQATLLDLQQSILNLKTDIADVTAHAKASNLQTKEK